MVPLGKLVADEIPVFSVTVDVVEVLAGLNGVTLIKLVAAPDIPIVAVVLDSAALVEPYTNCMIPVVSYNFI